MRYDDENLMRDESEFDVFNLHTREAELDDFQDEWDQRPTYGDLYGRGCYHADEVALTDEEYELFG